MNHVKNVSSLISLQAKERPQKKSIVYPIWYKSRNKYKYTYYTFKELEIKINQFCHRLESFGVKRGDKVLFFVKPNLDFCAITFALFRMGAVPTFIDPGMGRKKLLKCIQELQPEVMIGIPAVHYLSHFFKKSFSSVNIFITTAKSDGFRARSIYKNLDQMKVHYDPIEPEESELAAILYTSGGTGAPKGVLYTHDIFINQTAMLKDEFNLNENHVDIPGFPLFSFFTLAMGMTSVIPDMDFSKPAQCDPEKLYNNIVDSKASFIAGSPAIWERLAQWCVQTNKKIPFVKYVVMFGAPVSEKIHRDFKKCLIQGDTYTPYGATECLPISCISGSEVLSNTLEKTNAGKGICVGHMFKNVQVKIIKYSNETIDNINKAEIQPVNKIGEIIVSSPNVTLGYYNLEEQTQNSKIYDGDKVWHRMGDMGYLDLDGKLWFCGRKKHIVESQKMTFYPVTIEPYFNSILNVKRSAVISLQDSRVGLVLELEPSSNKKKALSDAKSIIHENELGYIEEIFIKDKFPVDIRHNIKIDRTALSKEFSS